MVHYASAWRRHVAALIASAVVASAAVSVVQLKREAWDGFAPLKHLSQFIERAPLPVAFAGPHQFLRAYFYLPPPLREKIYFVSERQLMRKKIGNDSNHLAFERLKPFVPINLIDRCAFTSAHRAFLVLNFGHAWFVDELIREGATVDLLELNVTGAELLRVTTKEPSGC